MINLVATGGRASLCLTAQTCTLREGHGYKSGNKSGNLNFLFIKEEYRGNGFAKQAVLRWEAEMKKQGCRMTLISTQADEGAQHLYRKLGYIDCGGLLFNNTPFDQPMELFFRKVL